MEAAVIAFSYACVLGWGFILGRYTTRKRISSMEARSTEAETERDHWMEQYGRLVNAAKDGLGRMRLRLDAMEAEASREAPSADEG